MKSRRSVDVKSTTLCTRGHGCNWYKIRMSTMLTITLVDMEFVWTGTVNTRKSPTTDWNILQSPSNGIAKSAKPATMRLQVYRCGKCIVGCITVIWHYVGLECHNSIGSFIVPVLL